MNKDNYLLTLAGFITWSGVAYVEFGRLAGSSFLWPSVLGYGVFLLLFLMVGSGYAINISLRKTRIILLVQLCIALLLMLVHVGQISPVLLVVWAAQLPDYFSRRAAVLQVLISNLLFYYIQIDFWHFDNAIITALIYLGFQLFALSTSFARVSERRAREQLEQVNQQLLTTRIILAQSSKQDERLRIARDLHDILGHQLTALNLQLEILQHKVAPELQISLADTKNLAKQLLDNIRAVVRNQRTPLTVDIRQAVQALALRLPQLQLTLEGELQLESAECAEQLLLCIQEGISNALRHGRATKIHILLQQQQHKICIFVDDNGRGCPNTINPGSGLLGINERLQLFNGSSRLTPLAQGARLQISLEQQHA
ncbi:sensor histidine kinase [Cellvibrio sp. OA-2007]|uniref:sensor histidine kinase n=1 Tax=Cellvibrio sp. OA-2007 TaxID=529823 RepID=UPI0007824F75|nr:histidine kinase [Cellvibrio sp. OA-2007]